MPEHFEPRTLTTRHLPDAGGDDATISLKPVVEFLATYRKVIGFGIAAAVTVTTLVLAGMLLVLPTERTASMQFRLLFNGADENKYPNDSPFNAAEIVQTSVLAEVYKA